MDLGNYKLIGGYALDVWDVLSEKERDEAIEFFAEKFMMERRCKMASVVVLFREAVYIYGQCEATENMIDVTTH